MLFYRLELMTSTSLTTNITKLQGSGYLDMMRYICIFFLTSLKLDHVKQQGYFVIAFLFTEQIQRNGEKTHYTVRVADRALGVAGSKKYFAEKLYCVTKHI